MSQRIHESWQIVFLILCCVNSCKSSFIVTKAECKSLDLSFAYFKTCEAKTDDKGNTKLDFYVTMRYKKPIDDVMVSWTIVKYTIYLNWILYFTYYKDRRSFVQDIEDLPHSHIQWDNWLLRFHAGTNYCNRNVWLYKWDSYKVYKCQSSMSLPG